MHAEHCVIDFFLAISKLSINWKTTSDVTSVVAVFSAYVKQYQIAALALVIVLNIMQDIRVVSSRNDWCVCKATTTIR